LGKQGRNELCSCGSGLKYKKCCLAKESARFTYSFDERLSASKKLLRFTEKYLGKEDEDAFIYFFDQVPDDALTTDHELDEEWDKIGEAIYDDWFFFDQYFPEGDRVVDRVLSQDRSITSGERTYLEVMRDSCLKFYETLDVVPGVSIVFQDVLDGSTVQVHEKMGSQHIKKGDFLFLRIVSAGVSGQPEIDGSCLPIPFLYQRHILAEISQAMSAYQENQPGTPDKRHWKELVPFIHSLWYSCLRNPPIPKLANTDGEEILLTKLYFVVHNVEALRQALDGQKALQEGITRGDSDSSWNWTVAKESGDSWSLGHMTLKDDAFEAEVNSLERAERLRQILEGLAGTALVYRNASHQDLTESLRSRLAENKGQTSASFFPDQEESAEIEAFVLDTQARHYRRWLDESIPALKGHSPRAAASMPELKPALAQLIRQLEGFYQDALRRNEPAYDPSWMWDELGLSDGIKSDHPPALAHERWAEAREGFQELCVQLASGLRKQPQFDDRTSILHEGDLQDHLGVRRYLTDAEQLFDMKKADLVAEILAASNHDLHRRKTFWVDESLVYMLAQTEIDLPSTDLRLPFPALALVFTDRLVLSLAERWLARDKEAPQRGFILRVATVYVSERISDQDRLIRLSFAFDALGSELPRVVERVIRLKPKEKLRSSTRQTEDAQSVGPAVEPYLELQDIVVNALLYATSMQDKVEMRTPSPGHSKQNPAGTQAPVLSSETVFFLPGKIQLSLLRRMQALVRAPSGRQLFYRFMVRGHWRRPAKNWKLQQPRWIEPHWKGPDMAAVIERAYDMKP
jgi:hypothetical protein